MSTESSPGTVRGPGTSARARLFLRLAWASVALIPIGFLAGMLVGEGLLSMQGRESGVEQSPRLSAVLLAAAPALVTLTLPAVAAIVFGFGARERGARRGVVPAVIGIVVATYALLTNLLSLIVERLLAP